MENLLEEKPNIKIVYMQEISVQFTIFSCLENGFTNIHSVKKIFAHICMAHGHRPWGSEVLGVRRCVCVGGTGGLEGVKGGKRRHVYYFQ